MSNRLERLLLAFACSVPLLCAPAFAQDFFVPQNPDPAAIPSWPVTVPADKVFIVTLAQPGVRNACKVKSLTAQALTCSRSLGRKPVVYRAEQVEALLNPHDADYAGLAALSFLGAGGAIIYCATLLNPVTLAGAIVVGIFGGLIAATAGAFAIGDNTDHSDHLLYLAPGHTLSVKLYR